MADRKRLTRIYTRTGDDGTTGLVSGERVAKSHPRIEAYGTVDELSSVLGIARAVNDDRPDGSSEKSSIDLHLRRIQNELFSVGADLACTLERRPAQMKVVGPAETQRLESEIDRMNEVLGPLKEFILPGGGLLGAHLHLARTVCRRAERWVVALRQTDAVDPGTLVYLNRLSDFLFVFARWCAHVGGEGEHLWEH